MILKLKIAALNLAFKVISLKSKMNLFLMNIENITAIFIMGGYF